MFWAACALFGLLVIGVVLRVRRMGTLFSDRHLAALLARLPALKQGALESRDGSPATVRTDLLLVGYTIESEGGRWVHHLSVSNAVTPAGSAGLFFLGLLRAALRLHVAPSDVFVSGRHVFHLVVPMSEHEHAIFVDETIASSPLVELRQRAFEERSRLIPALRTVDVPLPGDKAA